MTQEIPEFDPARPPAAVLFDLDGVLIHSERIWHEVMNAGARRWGYPEIDDAAFAAAFGQGVVEDRDIFYPRQSLEEIAAFYDEVFLDYIEHLRVAPAVPAVFAALETRGIASAVVTNTPNPLATDLVRRAGASPAAVVGGNDIPNAKPAPDMLLRASEILGQEPKRCVLVGDSRFDREAAQAGGVPFIGLGIGGGVMRIEALDGVLGYLAALRR